LNKFFLLLLGGKSSARIVGMVLDAKVGIALIGKGIRL
jgi:hypothetical protein